MMMSLVTIAIVLAVGYIWSTRGFYSAVLHLGCAVAGGAIAFGVWEPVSLMLLGGGEWLAEIAWGVGLLLPFAAATAALAGIVNVTLRANAKCDDVSNIVGGAVCGAAIGVIASGILALSVANMRSKSDFLGFTPVDYDKTGGAARVGGLLMPVDKLVAGIYGFASEHALSTSTPLARWYPHLVERGHLMKMGPEESMLRFATRPDDAKLAGRYTVGEASPLSVQDLLKDAFDPNRVQKVVDLSGEEISSGQYQIEGYVIQCGPGMREKNGQVVLGVGHLTLVAVEPESGFSQAFQPFAYIAQAKGDKPNAGRWRFDGERVFVGSVGGASNPAMAFEFLLPKNFKPIALYVKGVRINLTDPDSEEIAPKAPFTKYASTAARDAAIKNGSLLAASLTAQGTELDRSASTPFRTTSNDPNLQNIVSVTNSLPFTLNKGNMRGVKIDDNNFVIDGQAEYFSADKLPPGSDKALVVNKLLVDPTTVIVLVDVSPGKPFDLIGNVASQLEGAPTLVDDLERPQYHQCVGYIYEDSAKFKLRYTPGSPISDKGELPSLSRSRTDQKLRLIFRCSLNVRIKYFAIGNKAVKEMTPVLRLDTPQNTGR